MNTIAVTGAAGVVGQRALHQFGRATGVETVVAIDRSPRVNRLRLGDSLVELIPRRLDLSDAVLADALAGVDVVVHLAEDPAHRGDPSAAGDLLENVIAAMNSTGVGHLVVLSSATVYGAHANNPVPITESEPRRPNDELGYAAAKCRLEDVAAAWAETQGAGLSIMRPTTTLSEHGASWVAAAIRAAASVRTDQSDPPVQFLHHDDLVSALVVAATGRLHGTYNVSPDGWIGPEAFRLLAGSPQVRVPEGINDRLLMAGRRLGIRSTPEGIEPYVRHPWVVANDRLRRHGWAPRYTSEEVYVMSTPPPPWALSAQRRQELALGVAGVGVAAVAGVLAATARRVTRP